MRTSPIRNTWGALAGAILLLSSPGWAVPITYTFSGTGSGDIGGVAFTSSFTIRIFADTDTFFRSSSDPLVTDELNYGPGSFFIDGVGGGDFAFPAVVGLYKRGTFAVLDFEDSPSYLFRMVGSDLLSLDLNVPTAPVFKEPPDAFPSFSPFDVAQPTTLGDLTIVDVENLTFAAEIGRTSVPEPSISVLLLLTLATIASRSGRPDRRA